MKVKILTIASFLILFLISSKMVSAVHDIPVFPIHKPLLPFLERIELKTFWVLLVSGTQIKLYNYP